jgi:hypothetical protein
MAGGLDQPYPPENLPLFEAICHEGGLAISEMPFGWEPRARFPAPQPVDRGHARWASSSWKRLCDPVR